MPYSRPEPLHKRHVLHDFACGEPPLDEWLKNHAAPSQAGGSAAVFVTADEHDSVVGYYALAAGGVEPEDATARLAAGQPKNRPISVVILGRLAVDLRHQRAGLGRSLLRDAMERTIGASADVGIRAMVVHAKTEEARDWYLQFGFEESPTDPFHLILLMKDMRKAAQAGL